MDIIAATKVMSRNTAMISSMFAIHIPSANGLSIGNAP
jgi:hypothetical protein